MLSSSLVSPSSSFAAPTSPPAKVLAQVVVALLHVRGSVPSLRVPVLVYSRQSGSSAGPRPGRRVRHRARPAPEMDAVLAVPAVGAEAGHVELAQLAAHVPVGAARALLAEPAVVVLAHGQLGVLLDVHVQTLVAVLAVAVLVEELALAHLAQVVLVQVVARVALLAQALEPVLAHVVVVVAAVVVL